MSSIKQEFFLSQKPKGMEDWSSGLGHLQKLGDRRLYSNSLLNQLRIYSHLKDYGVVMTSGGGILPIIPWLLDGLTMNSKLIVHLPPEFSNFQQTLRTQADLDIRFAYHFQSSRDFIADIQAHRIDMLILEQNQQEHMGQWLELMTDSGLLILQLDSASGTDSLEQYLSHSISQYVEGYFIHPLEGFGIMMTPKGIQHTQTRRGRRRRK